MSAPRTTGSQRWLRAIAAACGLTRGEKALCFALVVYLDWDTGVSTASMATLAHAVGWRPRAMQLAVRSLAERGVVSYPGGVAPSRGGSGAGGRSNLIRLHLDALEALKGAPRARIGGARHDRPTRTPRPPGAHAATEGGAPRAPNQFREQREPTTTTTVPGGALGGGYGGGGGGGAFYLGGACGGPEPTGVPAGDAPAPPPHDPAVSRQGLLDAGVSRPKAAALSPHHAPEVIDAAMAWINVHGKNSFSPAGLLVTLLEDGTALEAWRKAERQRRADAEERAARDLHARRCDALRGAFGALTTAEDPEIRAEAARREAALLEVWPNVDALCRSGAVPDELLFAETIDATAIVEAAWDAAYPVCGADEEVLT